jgi:hypothetical protein
MTKTQTTSLKDGLKQVRSQGGDASAHQGEVNRGASAPLGGQAGQNVQEG